MSCGSRLAEQGFVRVVGGAASGLVESRSDGAAGPRSGTRASGRKGWRCCLAHPIHICSLTAPASPFVPREGALGSDGDSLPKVRRSLPHSPPPSKPSRLSRLGVFVESHRGTH